MTSEGNSALLSANVDQMRFSGNKISCFPRDQSLSFNSYTMFIIIGVLLAPYHMILNVSDTFPLQSP